jgi:Zn-dependent protease
VIIAAVVALGIYGILATGLLGDALDPGELFAKIAILLLAFPVHEFAHAAAAVSLGDPTPKEQGRLTLNPLRHLDPVGAVLLLIAGFGWAKPVQWNPRNIDINPRLGSILVAFAGPFSNLIMAVIAMAVLGILYPGYSNEWVLGAIYFFVQINVLLAVFNMIPVPPLDGSHILFAILPASAYGIFSTLSRFGFLIIFAVALLFPQIVTVPTQFVMSLLESIFL